MLRLKTNLKIAPITICIVSAIDVIFLLFLFFILNSPWVVQPGISISLPETVSANNISIIPANKMVLLISATRDANGEQVMLFNNKPVKLKDFEREFREEIRKTKKLATAYFDGEVKYMMPVLIIKADVSTSHGLLSYIRSLARTHGVSTNDTMVFREEK